MIRTVRIWSIDSKVISSQILERTIQDDCLKYYWREYSITDASLISRRIKEHPEQEKWELTASIDVGAGVMNYYQKDQTQ